MKNIKDITILVLVIIIIFLRSCTGDCDITETQVITKTEIKYDTITNEVTEYVPKLVTRILRKTDTVRQTQFITHTDTVSVPQAIDTNAILEDYFASYVYLDIQNFDSIKIEIQDTISENKIVSRSVKYSMLYPTITITNTHYINRTWHGSGYYNAWHISTGVAGHNELAYGKAGVGGLYTADGERAPIIGQWGHVALVRSSGTVKMYVNGVEVMNTTADYMSGGGDVVTLGAFTAGYPTTHSLN